ncbi:C25 family cysteine peptidase [Levilinea saccharolytica]|uniref:Gingipain domain-containing protein n=1 Tax=Levilinea saccharolytica TaxID=229921 RepID=A0A0P6Y826_9CHLR|nr:C25 family cysteine peptidase [Levilinea saccharolytica]KPL85089.1 hypothetical protein ADN01_06880 [Levilinea saccharolytica]GAP18201.1 peptidase family C25 [Levilinea saccharolytica]
MNPKIETPSGGVQIIGRAKLVLLLTAALESRSYRFARQAAVSWLAIFPGDLTVQWALARAWMGEGRLDLATPILEKLAAQDPEDVQVQLALAEAYRENKPEMAQEAGYQAAVLGWDSKTSGELPQAYAQLRTVRKLILAGEYSQAEAGVYAALGMMPTSALAAVLHLRIAMQTQDAAARRQLAQLYHTRWPDTLVFTLALADADLRAGQEANAVQLLHQAVSNDPAAQIPVRLWGETFRYRPLWPVRLEMAFDLPVPVDVSARLGGNNLATGEGIAVEAAAETADAAAPAEETPATETAAQEGLGHAVGDESPIEETAEASESLEETLEAFVQSLERTEGSLDPVAAAPEAAPAAQVSEAKSSPAVSEGVQEVAAVLDHLAERLQQTEAPRADGRYPVYVVFSTHTGLEKKYGLQTAEIIEREMQRLAEAVSKRRHWSGLVFLPDAVKSDGPAGMSADAAVDPWQLKLALTDLDQALAKKGQMIGALVIIGGPDVVPHHRLPNPSDDDDAEVPSDNPYATLDSNYFVAEWPVGRIPGEKGSDAGMLLEQIRRMTRYHSQWKVTPAWVKPLLMLVSWLDRIPFLRSFAPASSGAPSFGYSASVWRRSSLAAFRPVGDGKALLVSPPEFSGSFEPKRLTHVDVGYYNLHGLPDTAEWYGQRDFSEAHSGPDYPVALSAKDLAKNGRAPKVVFTEACYGGLIENKSEAQSLCLRFLSIGSTAVVASTVIAYGSVATPLIGADLLGQYFWKHLRDGRPVGEALLRARLDLVKEMTRRQGFLDAEDQKTLISFVLYGDPLASWEGFRANGKNIARLKTAPTVNTVQESAEAEGSLPKGVTKEALLEVKQVVAPYLPGLDHAEVRFGRQHSANSPKQANGAAVPQNANGRVVVTLEKQVKIAQHVHHHFARATLDAQGKIVKLAVSR